MDNYDEKMNYSFEPADGEPYQSPVQTPEQNNSHVFNLGGHERAIRQRLFKNGAGMVRMDVHLDDLVVRDEHKAVAEIGEEGTQQLRILVVLSRDDKLRAVAERDVLRVKLGEIRLFLGIAHCFLRRGDIVALKAGEHGAYTCLSSGCATVYRDPKLSAALTR